MKSESPLQLPRDAWIVPLSHQVSARMGDEVSILNLWSGTYHGLGGIGARIWELVSQPTRLGDIEQVLLGEYDVTPEILRRDLDRLIRGLLERGLVEVQVVKPPAPAGSE